MSHVLHLLNVTTVQYMPLHNARNISPAVLKKQLFSHSQVIKALIDGSMNRSVAGCTDAVSV